MAVNVIHTTTLQENLLGVILEMHKLHPVRPPSATTLLRWSVPESTPACRATDPDLCLLWMRANEKTNSPHASIPPEGRRGAGAGGAFVGTVPLSLKAATCLDEPAAWNFCPVCALVVGVKRNKSGTCLLRQHHH